MANATAAGDGWASTTTNARKERASRTTIIARKEWPTIASSSGRREIDTVNGRDSVGEGFKMQPRSGEESALQRRCWRE